MGQISKLHDSQLHKPGAQVVISCVLRGAQMGNVLQRTLLQGGPVKGLMHIVSCHLLICTLRRACCPSNFLFRVFAHGKNYLGSLPKTGRRQVLTHFLDPNNQLVCCNGILSLLTVLEDCRDHTLGIHLSIKFLSDCQSRKKLSEMSVGECVCLLQAQRGVFYVLQSFRKHFFSCQIQKR